MPGARRCQQHPAVPPGAQAQGERRSQRRCPEDAGEARRGEITDLAKIPPADGAGWFPFLRGTVRICSSTAALAWSPSFGGSGQIDIRRANNAHIHFQRGIATNSLEQHWMPFTSNRDFKAAPRMVTKSEGDSL